MKPNKPCIDASPKLSTVPQMKHSKYLLHVELLFFYFNIYLLLCFSRVSPAAQAAWSLLGIQVGLQLILLLLELPNFCDYRHALPRPGLQLANKRPWRSVLPDVEQMTLAYFLVLLHVQTSSIRGTEEERQGLQRDESNT